MGASARESLWLARLDRRLPEIYLALGLILTSLLCLLTAPFFGPDEPHHAARVIALGHGAWMAHMGGAEAAREAGAEIDANALRVMDGMDAIRMAWEKRSADFHNRSYGAVEEQLQQPLAGIRWGGERAFAPFPNTAVYPPSLYLPEMVGWRLGEAADWTILESLRLARLLAALTAVGLGWLALRWCACTRWMLMPFLLLPSTLFLNACTSQDAVLLSVAALVPALVSRPLVQRREFTGRELAAMAVLLTLCATARPPYAALALVLFLPVVELRITASRRWIEPLAAFIAVLAGCAFWRHLVLPFGVDAADEADPVAQMAFLHGHPFAGGLTVLKGTMLAAADFMQRGLYVVGWNDLLAPNWMRLALTVCLAIMVLLAPGFPLKTWAGRLLLGVTVVAPLIGISLAEYVIWTPPGGPNVYGVQPRYWLPMMPLAMLLALSLPGRGWIEREGFRAARVWLLTGSGVAMAAIACSLPWMAARAFYLDSVTRVLRLNLR